MHSKPSIARILQNNALRAEKATNLGATREHIINNPHRQLTFLATIKLLENEHFFNSLQTVGHSNKVKAFDFYGKRFVVKDTRGSEMQGLRYEKFRAAFLAHQKAIRAGKIKPQKYTLRSIKVIKRVGNFLIMNYIEGKPLPRDFDKAEHTALREAFTEMKANMEEMKKGVLFYSPQYIDVIVAKEPILGNPKRTKFVFYLPYDHT